MSTIERGYLAGLIDGEGTITLTVKQKNARRHLAVTISSTERNILEYAMKIIGVGKITTKITYKEQHSPSFTYQVYSRQALDVLKQVFVHLQSYKKKRAQLALKHYVALTPRNGKYTKELLKKRKQFEESFLSILPNDKHRTK